MSNPAISVSHLSKYYRLGSGFSRYATLAGTFSKRVVKGLKALNQSGDKNNASPLFCALDDVSFQVNKGEVVGIIGPNGAGKSTLLKIISKISSPDKGKVEIYGRVASLLEVGTGFHDDLTGLENIYVNGTLLGMSKKEVDTRLNEIVEYAGIAAFLNTPIKKYSTGMKLRLAFAVAAHLDAEILIIDEVLAVGDANFQQKCIKKMSELTKDGRTVLFVSHNMSALKNLCNKAVYLDKGRIVAEGNTAAIIQLYLNENLKAGAELDAAEIRSRADYCTRAAVPTFSLKRVSISDSQLEIKRNFDSDEEIKIGLRIETLHPVKDMRVIVSLVDEDNTYLLSTQVSDNAGFITDYHLVNPGLYNLSCTIPPNMLGNNEYFITVEIIHPSVEHLILRKALSFEVKFAGYNNIQVNGYGQALMRPLLNWDFLPVHNHVN